MYRNEKNALDFFSLGVRTKQEIRKKIESQIADRAAAKSKSNRDSVGMTIIKVQMKMRRQEIPSLRARS